MKFDRAALRPVDARPLRQHPIEVVRHRLGAIGVHHRDRVGEVGPGEVERDPAGLERAQHLVDGRVVGLVEVARQLPAVVERLDGRAVSIDLDPPPIDDRTQLFRRISRPTCVLRAMHARSSTSPDPVRLSLTEAALASADRHWRTEMRRAYGPDAVLVYGYSPEGQGGLGTPLRRSYEARRVAVALWRRERRSVVR